MHIIHCPLSLLLDIAPRPPSNSIGRCGPSDCHAKTRSKKNPHDWAKPLSEAESSGNMTPRVREQGSSI